jgi:hypothetical protein
MELSEATSILARTPDVLETLMAGLAPEWLQRNDGPGTWSAHDIVGHLAHADVTNWLPRAEMILAYGTARQFEPFDREAMLGRDPVPTATVLAELREARHAGLDRLASLGLTDAELGRHGLHPDLGEVMLGQMVAAWVAHDLTHVAQVSEVLARRYRDDVGPWRAYMPKLDEVAAAE